MKTAEKLLNPLIPTRFQKHNAEYPPSGTDIEKLLCEKTIQKHDFTHAAEFLCKLKKIKIRF